MLFSKVPFLANFSFSSKFESKSQKLKVGGRELQAEVRHFEGNIHHIRIVGKGLWSEDVNLVPVIEPDSSADDQGFEVGPEFQLKWKSPKGTILLESAPGFGVMGDAHLFAFGYDNSMKFYGLGENIQGKLELGRGRYQFWNVDALGDFHWAQWKEHPCNPYYVSVPYMIVQRGEEYIGILLHNPYPSWMDTGTDPSFFGTEDQNRRIVIGAENGMPSLWLIYGPSLKELTQKLQKLVGTTPRPPLWSLGYHQCRWEYKGEDHLKWLDSNMAKMQIPNDGLWLDIDYMDGYRVFTYSKEAFPNGVKHAVEHVAKNGRKVVPIIDPGIKKDEKYKFYTEGLEKNLFCLNPEGKPFVGFVWPGETVFPDFSMPEAREWWSYLSASFRQQGFGGAWIDMNDPSTGIVDPNAMLFRKGQLPHGAFRNQYALGMAVATRDGFLKAEPNERPFLLSRSGYTGMSRYSAIWTGDNVSNRFYLKASIATTINLGLSGIPFNGSDIGGFVEDTTETLMTDWVKAHFLFPFFRNHSGGSFKRQEPWQFSKKGKAVINHYTRLRYKLLPYLYQAFIQQEQAGDTLVRPLNYHFEKTEVLDDVYMIGDSILQAPCLDEGLDRRIKLPGRSAWFDLRTGVWQNRSAQLLISNVAEESAVFVQDGSLIPTQNGLPTTNAKDFKNLELHVFLTKGSCEAEFTLDDGESFGYQKGEQAKIYVKATRKGDLIELKITGEGEEKFFPTWTIISYEPSLSIRVNGEKWTGKAHKVHWTGAKPLAALRFNGKAK